MDIFDACGQGNARKFSARRATLTLPDTKVRFPQIATEFANIVIKGPALIRVRRDADDYERLSGFVPILRINIGYTGRVGCWAVYQEDEGRIPGCVLRHATWNRKAGPRSALQGSADEPIVKSITWYLNDHQCVSIKNSCELLDNILTTGLVLEPRPTSELTEWNYLSIFRSFSYGYMDLGWNFAVQNTPCEIAVFRLTHVIEETLREHQINDSDTIEEMEMLYNLPPSEVLGLL